MGRPPRARLVLAGDLSRRRWARRQVAVIARTRRLCECLQDGPSVWVRYAGWSLVAVQAAGAGDGEGRVSACGMRLVKSTKPSISPVADWQRLRFPLI